MTATFILSINAQNNAHDALKKEFYFRVSEVTGKIKNRLDAYELVLRGTAAMFNTSQEITRHEFQDYVYAHELQNRYPGILGIGFSQWLTAPAKARHLARVRAEGFPNYRLWPEGERDAYSPIIYIEPFDRRNRRVLGYDMYAEPLRHAAMAKARDQNQPVISSKVTLLHETGARKQAGFLMYLPVYRNDAPHDTLAQRRANLQGWVYAPFRMTDLMQGILGRYFGETDEALNLDIYDGDMPTPENLMYDSDAVPQNTQHHPQFESTTHLEIGGHRWTVNMHSLPDFESRLKSTRGQIIMIAGIAVSLLLAWVMWLLVNGRVRAMQLAVKMNLELLETSQQLRESERYQNALLANLPTAVMVLGPDSAIRFCNTAALQILGLIEAEAIGSKAQNSKWRLLHEDGSPMPAEAYPVYRALAEKKALYGYVFGIDRGQALGICWLLINAYPELDSDGQVCQVVVSFLDLTERRRTEEALLKSLREIKDLYHNASCGYHTLDKHGVFLLINDTELSWLGYTREEIVGRTSISDVLTPASRQLFSEHYPAFMQQGWLKDLELEFVRKDGTLLPALINATAVRDSNGDYLMSRATIFDITERKQAGLALQASERHTRQLLGNLPAGVVVYAPDCSIRYLNLAAQTFFKLNDKEAWSRSTTDLNWRFLHEDGSALPPHELPERKVLADRQPLKNYVVGILISGQEDVRWALFNAFPELDSNGVIDQVVVSFVDITERILAYTQLRNTRAELEHILDVNPAATYQVQLGSNSTFFRSKAIVDMMGYALEDWREPRFWVSHIHPDDRERVSIAQNQLLENNTLQHEYRFRHQDGRWVWIMDRVHLVRDQDGKGFELVGAWLDITPRKQAEISLKTLNRFFSVLTRTNEAIVRATCQNQLFGDICRIAVQEGQFVMAWVGLIKDEAHEIIPVSHFGHEAGYLDYLRKAGILGFDGPTAQALQTGKFRLSQDIAADVAMNPWRQEALQRGYKSSAAFPIHLGDKAVGTINLYAADAHYFNADTIHLLGDLARDISFALGAFDQKDRRAFAEKQLLQLNQQLEQRVAERTQQLENANKELESFSYSVSHDLRAPLRSIDGFSDILQKTYAERLDDKGRDYLGRVHRASKRMGELIDDLLQLSRVTLAELRKERVDLSAIARSIAAEMRETAPQRQVTWIIQDDVIVQADGRLMKVVLENLLGNAWKFTSNQPASRIEFGLLEQNDEKIIFVRDNGAGFDMQYAGKLFGAFQRLHKTEEFEGTGIGLATVQRIIHRHGGRISAEGQLGHGAAIYFTL